MGSLLLQLVAFVLLPPWKLAPNNFGYFAYHAISSLAWFPFSPQPGICPDSMRFCSWTVKFSTVDCRTCLLAATAFHLSGDFAQQTTHKQQTSPAQLCINSTSQGGLSALANRHKHANKLGQLQAQKQKAS